MSGFIEMLKDLNTTKEKLDIITLSGTTIEFDSDFYYKDKSSIHGLGVFALKNINKGEVIGIGSIDNKYKTTLGRFTNHSDFNNAMFCYLKNNDVAMIAVKYISKNEEILINYRDHVLNKIYLNEKRL